MMNNRVDEKGTTKRGAWFWRRITVPVVLVLLVLGFVGITMATATAGR